MVKGDSGGGFLVVVRIDIYKGCMVWRVLDDDKEYHAAMVTIGGGYDRVPCGGGGYKCVCNRGHACGSIIRLTTNFL